LLGYYGGLGWFSWQTSRSPFSSFHGGGKEIPPEELGQSREREPQAIRKDISRGEEYFPPKSIHLRMASAMIEPSVLETLVRAKASYREINSVASESEVSLVGVWLHPFAGGMLPT